MNENSSELTKRILTLNADSATMEVEMLVSKLSRHRESVLNDFCKHFRY